MLKIGIFTHYYKSSNYGGNLQAYALCKFLNNSEYLAEQISYNRVDDFIGVKRRANNRHCVLKIFRRVRKVLIQCLKWKTLHQIKKRENRIREFNLQIPHSREKGKFDLCNLGKEYDCFITGSDQVWHPNAVCDGYLLNFDGAYKMSYAASFATQSLPREIVQYYSNCLKNFDAISVREQEAVDLVKSLSNHNVQWVLDPTLLLTREEWGKIQSERKINERYVFCFFLGDLSFSKNLILSYAKKRELKIVSMPYLTGVMSKGANFGDYLEYAISPNDFLSLVCHAEYVFTDSFHATVFSHIYKKNFFVFNRAGLKSMNDRIYSLISLFDTQDRFCDTKERESLEYIESLSPIDYNKSFPKFEEMKEKSINFLKENLKRAEEKIHGNQ